MSTAIYEAVTARIVQSLEQGVVPWRKPWNSKFALPINAVSNRPYRGVNVFLLGVGLFEDYRWLSFKQAQQLGGHVRAGERSMLAIFWKRLRVEQTDSEESAKGRGEIPLLRYYHVFNVEQCEGLKLPPLSHPEPTSPAVRIEHAESMLAAMPDPPQIRRHGSSAWYRPQSDLIQIPRIESCWSTDAFYATLFHELGHATGHEKRLNRAGITERIQFGSETYSREELVAELTSAFCCSCLGLDNSLVENSASYLDGWLTALKSDPKVMTVAASQAQRATDYIRCICFPDVEEV